VVLQSFYPNHYALELARRQDYDGFFRREIEFRKLMGYPPASRLVAFLVSDRRLERALRTAERVAAALRARAAAGASGGSLRILGPAMAPLERLRGEYRCQILLKSPPGSDPLPIVHDVFTELAARKAPLRKVRVDVDPLSLL
jgi:primosomal protein N' (replication factor Y)